MSKCKLPTFSFSISLPSFSFKLPKLPAFNFSLKLYCPLD